MLLLMTTAADRCCQLCDAAAVSDAAADRLEGLECYEY